MLKKKRSQTIKKKKKPFLCRHTLLSSPPTPRGDASLPCQAKGQTLLGPSAGASLLSGCFLHDAFLLGNEAGDEGLGQQFGLNGAHLARSPANGTFSSAYWA